MGVEFKYPWMGIAIPVAIISYLHVSTSILMHNDKSVGSTSFTCFQFAAMMLWISYYLAIVTPAGSPSLDFKLDEKEFKQPQTMWRKYCIKCKNYKPERSHHCKKCGKCVLKMDHHCPWTNNCIGYHNLPHFMRFLVWILVTTAFGFIYFIKKIWHIYKIRDLPSYFISTKLLAIYIVNILLVVFVLFTIFILFLRSMDSIMNNQTMIESWEWDRIQDNFFTENFWRKVRSNYSYIYPEQAKFPDLKSWKVNYRILKKNTSIPINFSFDDLVFPYDLGSSYENLVDSLGPVYAWLYPFGGPVGNGTTFIKDNLGEDQIKLPFPMDGTNVDPDNSVTTVDDDNELVLKSWSNYMGETLDDFGVDMDTEDYELSKVR